MNCVIISWDLRHEPASSSSKTRSRRLGVAFAASVYLPASSSQYLWTAKLAQYLFRCRMLEYCW